MIHELLTFIENKLNNYLKLKLGITENKVVVTSLPSSSGGSSMMLSNVIVMNIINIEEEKTHNPRHQYIRTKGGFSQLKPPLNLNVYVMFSTCFNQENYLEGVKVLSSILGFFQVNNLFQATEYPALAEMSDKVSVELVTMNINEINQLWGSLASNYQPSVLYRFRSIVIQESKLKDDITSIKAVG